MTLQARTKKTLALVLAALVIVVAGVAATVWKLVDSAEPGLPSLTAYARGETVAVEPAQYCNLYLEDCVENPIGELDVPAGYPLQLSLPAEITDAPWRIITVYGDMQTGQTYVDGAMFEAGARRALTVPSDPDLQLLGIEIQLPSAVVDEAGEPIAHAVWAIKTF
ncbi:DUF2771 domain-containing protein [Rhodococcus sp. CH91]|uniref:DUF2771 domain-containing protein n=1 Tax=Rhodococcus sp. CH91 TaxID=2910256 RepID=UPI001F4B43B1|nr:DUF2771 domain-containing protein [Rhodococcus sp. CH91]